MISFLKKTKYLKALYVYLQTLFVILQYHYLKAKYLFRKPFMKDTYRIRKLEKSDTILYCGTDYAQDYSGFIPALKKLFNVVLFYKEDGSYGVYKGSVFDASVSEQNFQKIRALILEHKPRVLLMQSWGFRLSHNHLCMIRHEFKELIIGNICMDDRHSFYHYGSKKRGSAGLLPYLDFTMVTAPEIVHWHKCHGVHSVYFPLASDPDIFFPVNQVKKYDVGFVGANYGVRSDLINALQKSGLIVKAYGNGWPSGRLPLEKTNQFYNECRIVLGVSTILGAKNFCSMKLRDFDVPMSGNVYLTLKTEELSNIFDEGDEILFYKNKHDLVTVANMLAKNDNKIMKIGAMAREKAFKMHAYDIRLENTFKLVGIM
ncbi:glycosyltransferase [Aeromonas veronii]